MRLFRYKNTGALIPFQGIEPPAGTIIIYAGSGAAPSGWLTCSGALLNKSDYANLSAAIGTSFNTGGETAGQFRIPDLRGRVPVGAGTGTGGASSGTANITGGSSLTARSLGATISNGQERVTLSAAESGIPAHSHSLNETSHGHSIASDGSHNHQNRFNSHGPFKGGSSAVAYLFLGGGYPTYSTTGPQQSKTVTVNTVTSNISDGSGGSNVTGYTSSAAASSHLNIQPSVVMQYLIKT